MSGPQPLNASDIESGDVFRLSGTAAKRLAHCPADALHRGLIWTDTDGSKHIYLNLGDPALGASGYLDLTTIASGGIVIPEDPNAIVFVNDTATDLVSDPRATIDLTNLLVRVSSGAGAGLKKMTEWDIDPTHRLFRQFDDQANQQPITEINEQTASRWQRWMDENGTIRWEMLLRAGTPFLTAFTSGGVVAWQVSTSNGKQTHRTNGTLAAPLSGAAISWGRDAAWGVSLVGNGQATPTQTITTSASLGVTAASAVRAQVVDLDGALVLSCRAIATGANAITLTLSSTPLTNDIRVIVTVDELSDA